MVWILGLSAVDLGIDPVSGQTKDYEASHLMILC
jgi:hypothetical protein